MPYKVILTFEFLWMNSKCDHSNESYLAVISCVLFFFSPISVMYFLSICQVLSSGRQKWLKLLESISTREEAVAGGVAIAAAFATYLGPYSFTFRREMLTVHWPQCLDERGVMLVVDSSTPYAGAEVFMMEKLQEVRASSGKTTQAVVEEPTQPDENANENDISKQNGKLSFFLFCTAPVTSKAFSFFVIRK